MEITNPIQLTKTEVRLLGLHSVLNIMNVLLYNLSRLENAYGNYPLLSNGELRIFTLSRALKEDMSDKDLLNELLQFPKELNQLFQELQGFLRDEGQGMDVFDEVYDNVKTILQITEVRIRELLARVENPLSWGTFSLEELQRNYQQALSAIEKNSLGSYSIVFDLAEHEEGKYLVQFTVESHNGNSVTMPNVFQDILRDLLANARKYTPPGGTISGGINDTGKEVHIVVQDSGMGIPSFELPAIVDFGFRASNVQSMNTFGGGFGLTKAYYFTKLFGGRFWIDSVLGEGTKIKISLPVVDTI